MIVRYTSSSVGPYDELAYIPGKFDTPDGKKHWRTTNIYVSSEDSVYNGRLHWNIPKHLAIFSFTPLSEKSKTIRIEVSMPSSVASSTKNPPFFTALCTPFRYIPSFPFNTKYIPFFDVMFTQPPLPGSPSSYSEVGTKEWKTITADLKGKATFTRMKPAGGEGLEEGELADGIHFPKIKPLFGIHLKGMDMELLAAIETTNDKNEGFKL
ncbi:hypothetical protein M422DRAFT_256003 [Sphaerobolus stellatus SS14]|uniref:Uncharacterized protein n=1 Tax=Sphaerobolus stellatus (strain SS14) TaxID=990650 RepID=A0A0C9VI69_SPHS4|nr:hypothetical protein M422DRAFT_256003 [Sphaerobolus stellatus SS14]